MKRIVATFLFLFFVFFILQNGGKPQPRVLIRFHASPGDTFAYSIENESYISQNYMNNLTEINVDSLINCKFEVLSKNDSGVYKIKGVLYQIIISYDDGKENFVYKSTENSDQPIARVFKKLLNNEFTFDLSEKGDVTNLSGFDKKIEKIFEIVPLPGDVNPDKLKKYVYGLLSNQVMQENIAYMFYYPEKAVTKKDKWSKQSEKKGAKQIMNFYVSSLKNNIMHIIVNGKMDLKQSQKNEEKSTSIDITLNRTMSGAFDINTKTGYSEKTAFQIKQESTILMNQGNNSITIPMTNQTKITCTKL